MAQQIIIINDDNSGCLPGNSAACNNDPIIQAALDAVEKAKLWAEQNEDVEVQTGLYSAKHWALKAAQNASPLFPEPTILTRTLGALPVGTDIGGKNAMTVLLEALAAFKSPSFLTFDIGNAYYVKLGTAISGNNTFSWSFDYIDDVANSTLAIKDINNAIDIVTLESKTSPYVANLDPISYSVPTVQEWRAEVTDLQGNTITSPATTITWRQERFYGFVSTLSPTDGEIQGLLNDLIDSAIIEPVNIVNGAGSNYPALFIPIDQIPGVGALEDRIKVYVNSYNVSSAFNYSTINFTNSNGVTRSYAALIQASKTAAASLTIETKLIG